MKNKLKLFLMKILGPLLMTKCRIVENQELSAHFHLIKIKGNKFKKAQWIAGQKIQLNLGENIVRSSTPTRWNTTTGEVETLIFTHDNGPGARWAKNVKAQEKAIFLGPRASFKILPEHKEIIFFGDETAMGLAYVLKENHPEIKLHSIFESDYENESINVLKKFNLETASLYSRNKEDEISEEILRHFQANKPHILLSGKQQSIVKIRNNLIAKGVEKDSIILKVYWGWKDDPKGKLSNQEL